MHIVKNVDIQVCQNLYWKQIKYLILRFMTTQVGQLNSVIHILQEIGAYYIAKSHTI